MLIKPKIHFKKYSSEMPLAIEAKKLAKIVFKKLRTWKTIFEDKEIDSFLITEELKKIHTEEVNFTKKSMEGLSQAERDEFWAAYTIERERLKTKDLLSQAREYNDDRFK